MIKNIIFYIFCNILVLNTLYSRTDTLKIYYSINQFNITKEYAEEIDAFFNLMKDREIIDIQIQSYTDFLSSTNYNIILSQKRAITVKNYIIAKGFEKFISKTLAGGELPPELENQPNGILQNRKSLIICKFKENSENEIKGKNVLGKQLNDVKVGENIVLKNFNFLPGRHYLTAKSQPELEILLFTLAENPKLKIEIQGHICCEYNDNDGYDQDTYTRNLSVNRAKYIYDFLIKNNIKSDRLSYKGFGSAKPLVYPEITEDDQNKNRRVEIVIIEK